LNREKSIRREQQVSLQPAETQRFDQRLRQTDRKGDSREFAEISY
jgi:hypothetical protein